MVNRHNQHAAPADDSAAVTATVQTDSPSAPTFRPELHRRTSQAHRPHEADPGLAERVARAKHHVAFQYEPALYEELTEEEIAAERELHEWMRARRRRLRKRSFRWEQAMELRALRAEARAQRRDEREQRWHAEAVAERRRATSPDAVVGRMYRRMTWMSRSLRLAMGIGMVWSAVNVGRNLQPDHSGPAGLTWWALWITSFAFEGMISLPIAAIMQLSNTAAESGREIDRSRIALIGGVLLLVTVGLNSGWHLFAGDWGWAAVDTVAPTMVVLSMWIHSWCASRYGTLIDLERPKTAEISGDRLSAADVSAVRDIGPAAVSHRPSPNVISNSSGAARATGSSSDAGLASDMHDRPSAMALEHEFASAASDIATVTQDQCERIAHQLVMRKETRTLSKDDLVMVLQIAQTGASAHVIATQMTTTTGKTYTRSTIDRAIGRARAFGFRTTTNPGREAITQSA